MREIVSALKNARSIAITSHIKPDGDAVGSMLALLRILRTMGKSCRAISPSHIPTGLTFLLRSQDEILRYSPIRDDPALEQADLFLVLDCANLERAGEVGQKMRQVGKSLLVIDHHSTNENFGTLNHVRHDVSCTAELIFDLLDHLPLVLSLDIAIPD